MDDLRLISVVVVSPAPAALSWARKAVLKEVGRWALAWQAETAVSHLWQPAVQDG